jgi:hypothetical protein
MSQNQTSTNDAGSAAPKSPTFSGNRNEEHGRKSIANRVKETIKSLFHIERTYQRRRLKALQYEVSFLDRKIEGHWKFINDRNLELLLHKNVADTKINTCPSFK